MHNMKNEVKGQHRAPELQRTAENCRAFLDPQRQIYDTQNLTKFIQLSYKCNQAHSSLPVSLCLSPVCGKV